MLNTSVGSLLYVFSFIMTKLKRLKCNSMLELGLTIDCTTEKSIPSSGRRCEYRVTATSRRKGYLEYHDQATLLLTAKE